MVSGLEEDQNGPGDLVPLTIVSGGSLKTLVFIRKNVERSWSLFEFHLLRKALKCLKRTLVTPDMQKQALSEQNSQICPDSMKHSSQHVGESGEDTPALLLMGINEG